MYYSRFCQPCSDSTRYVIDLFHEISSPFNIPFVFALTHTHARAYYFMKNRTSGGGGEKNSFKMFNFLFKQIRQQLKIEKQCTWLSYILRDIVRIPKKCEWMNERMIHSILKCTEIIMMNKKRKYSVIFWCVGVWMTEFIYMTLHCKFKWYKWRYIIYFIENFCTVCCCNCVELNESDKVKPW